MTARKDSEKDTERPHYYSQFWLDIAAGKRIIGGPKPEDGEAIETETAESALQHRSGRVGESETFSNATLPTHGYQEGIAHPNIDEDYSDSEEDLAQEDLHEGDYQEDLPLDDDDVPDVDLSTEEEEITNEDNEPDYEEEDAEWGSRGGRKKAKSTRSNKVPPKKTGKTRRF